MKKTNLKEQLKKAEDRLFEQELSHSCDLDCLSDYVKNTSERQFFREGEIVNLFNDENFEDLKFLLIRFNEEQKEALELIEDIFIDDIRISQLIEQFDNTISVLRNCADLNDLKDFYSFKGVSKLLSCIYGRSE